MTSRSLATAALVLALTLSGCAAFPFVGPTCGPGGTDIGAIEGNATSVHLKGEVDSVNDSVLVLDDGTGQAAVLVDAGIQREVAPGDCVIARDALAVERSSSSVEVDVIAGELLKEEVVFEDESDV